MNRGKRKHVLVITCSMKSILFPLSLLSLCRTASRFLSLCLGEMLSCVEQPSAGGF